MAAGEVFLSYDQVFTATDSVTDVLVQSAGLSAAGFGNRVLPAPLEYGDEKQT